MQKMLPVFKYPTNYLPWIYTNIGITLIIVTLLPVCVTPAKNKMYDKISATHRLISMIALSGGMLLFTESLVTCL